MCRAVCHHTLGVIVSVTASLGLQVLCIQGFLACRKHADRVLLLAEMMAGCGFPCFKAGARTVQQLRRRFHLNLPESQARRHAHGCALVLHWLSRQPPHLCACQSFVMTRSAWRSYWA